MDSTNVWYKYRSLFLAECGIKNICATPSLKNILENVRKQNTSGNYDNIFGFKFHNI